MTAITDSVDLTQRSQSAYCLSDICFTLYKVQMGFGAFGTMIKLHTTTMEGLCLSVFTVSLVLCTSGKSDDPQCY